ncbi:MAG: GH3 auxin-responsive promoter family protein [Rikenellaceae bacterium]
MEFSHKIINSIFSRRISEIEEFMSDPISTQQCQFRELIFHLANCEYGKERGITCETSYEEFVRKISVSEYSDMEEYINRTRQGEANIIWDAPIKWYAKSSGTTTSKSKFIPVSTESIYKCQYRGMKDVIGLAAYSNETFNVGGGKTLTLGGAHSIDELSSSGARSGDLSSILIEHTPFYVSLFRTPPKEIALETDFLKKIEVIAETCSKQNITSFAGVPSWNLVLLEKVLEYTGKSNISEVWPNMELFMHGGVCFTPYRETYKKLIPSPQMKYIESYNASEGFFAIQDNPKSVELLLMLDYGIFYEFTPATCLDDMTKVVPLEGVKLGVNYAIIITTNGGLWRYMIGDTVKFTSISPYRIKITGRTKHYINAFGEEVIVDNSDKAIAEACNCTGATIREYTAAPIYMDVKEKGKHEWIIEFSKEPDSFENFCEILDKTLQKVNSDYEAKRKNNATLEKPIVRKVDPGTFHKWMEKRGKSGGQNKVPRLSNTREYVDSILEYIIN